LSRCRCVSRRNDERFVRAFVERGFVRLELPIYDRMLAFIPAKRNN
jgi:hypothetical protein